jgi:hypothetical protein
MTNQAPAKNNQPAPSTAAIQSRPGGPVSGISTPTPLEPIATAPSTKQIIVPSAHTAPTVESLSVLIAPTLASQYPGCYVQGFPRLLEAGLSPTTGPDESALVLRRAGIAALLVSISAGMTSNVLFAAAYQVRPVIQPTRIVAAGATSAELLRWAAVLDMFGYYLATAVLAYVLWRQLRLRNPVIADLTTLAGVGFALAGGAGAAVLAVFGSSLMHDYIDAAATEQVVIAAQFATLMAVVMRSIWQFLDGILIGVWWVGGNRAAPPP